jgi:hypothetical protein
MPQEDPAPIPPARFEAYRDLMWSGQIEQRRLGAAAGVRLTDQRGACGIWIQHGALKQDKVG